MDPGALPLVGGLGAFFVGAPMAEKKRKDRYRSKASYHSKDPEKRARQLANLNKTTRHKATVVPVATQAEVEQADIIEFATGILNVSFAERPAQEVVLRALYGLALDADQLDLYRQLTGCDRYEGTDCTEGVLAVGARGGKSFLTSVVALYEATRSKWRRYLNAGEPGYAVITATKQQQAEDIIGKQCRRLMEGSRIAHWVRECWASKMTLTNDMVVASFPCNSTAARGLPAFMLIFDEVAHFATEGVRADEAIFSALRPRQAQFPVPSAC